MSSIVRLLAICAAFWLPVASFGQDQNAADTAADAPAADAPGSALPELSLGVEEDSGVGKTYVAAEFADWQQRCVKTADGKDPCQIYQLLRDAQDNSVAEIVLFPLPEGGDAVAGANVITPLGTLLTANVRIAVDGGKARLYPFSFCNRVGCFSRIGFTKAEVEEFQRGNAATVTIASATAPDQPVALAVSLSGFTAGWKALLAGPPAVAE